MEFLQNVGLFFLQTLAIVLGVIAIILTIAALIMKNKHDKEGEVEVLNEKFDDQRDLLNSVVLNDEELKKEKKRLKALEKEETKSKTTKPKVYVLDFLKGDIQASPVDHFRKEVTALLSVAEKDQEVIINVESPGGIVHGYGLAAAQILRLRDHGLRVTVCVDKVAASGGYMMACVAHKILASPFAILGSIGVVAQVPNFNKVLKKYDVDYKEYTAGDYKRTVSIFGEITDKGEKKFLEQIEATHSLFKSFVGRFRPKLDLAKVATGEYWFGEDALKLGLIDEICTSDEYIFKKMQDSKVIRVSFEKKPSIADKISGAISGVLSSSLQKTIQSVIDSEKSKNHLQ